LFKTESKENVESGGSWLI